MILRSKANICTTPGDLQAPSLKQIYCVLPPPADICILVIGTSRLDLLRMSPVAPCLLAPVVIPSAVDLAQGPGPRWWLAEVCSGIRSASPFHSTEQQALVPRMHTASAPLLSRSRASGRQCMPTHQLHWSSIFS